MPGERILLVEDDPMNRRLVQFLLQSRGFTVYEAATGEEALQIARAQQPDLIVMDLQLPRMDGYTATRILKSAPSTQRIPVVALTALSMASDRERALAAGCNGFMTKPIDTKEFTRFVSRYLAPPPGSADRPDEGGAAPAGAFTEFPSR